MGEFVFAKNIEQSENKTIHVICIHVCVYAKAATLTRFDIPMEDVMLFTVSNRTEQLICNTAHIFSPQSLRHICTCVFQQFSTIYAIHISD